MRSFLRKTTLKSTCSGIQERSLITVHSKDAVRSLGIALACIDISKGAIKEQLT
jgi:hypothetical protein